MLIFESKNRIELLIADRHVPFVSKKHAYHKRKDKQKDILAAGKLHQVDWVCTSLFEHRRDKRRMHIREIRGRGITNISEEQWPQITFLAFGEPFEAREDNWWFERQKLWFQKKVEEANPLNHLRERTNHLLVPSHSLRWFVHSLRWFSGFASSIFFCFAMNNKPKRWRVLSLMLWWEIFPAGFWRGFALLCIA